RIPRGHRAAQQCRRREVAATGGEGRGDGERGARGAAALSDPVSLARGLVLVSAAAAGVILALALRLPAVLFGLAGLAAGGVIIGVELAVALREAPIAAARPAATPSAGRLKLLDTSAIIDGRIADLAGTGFLEGPLVVPRFVLRELQRLADGGDTLKRNRGKRGFEIVQRLQSVAGVSVEVVDDDVAETQEVDLKLLELARRRGAGVVTTDYNLNRLAEVSGIMVLNVNDLASALRPVVLPGEELRVQL